MNRNSRWMLPVACAFALALSTVLASPVAARLPENDPEAHDILELQAEFGLGPNAQPTAAGRPARPTAIPDIFGPGAVLTVGNVFMKCTNYGFDGNPFTNVSSDPSGQWPGSSAVEYLNLLGIAVGGVNPLATDPVSVRRVSLTTEWRPPTLDAEDRMYRSYDGILNGQRYSNDDGDREPLTGEARIDEDFLDGRDNDGDNQIDEDFGAIGQQMYTCVMRDDTPQAIQASAAERHVPLGLELQKSCWAYSIPGYTDFNVIQYDIYNRSGHTLDSVVIAFRTDMDCGPIEKSNYFSDDFGLPQYPFGDFMVETKPTDLRLQPGSDRKDVSDVPDGQALCPIYKVRVNGWSIADDDGDEEKTQGIGTIMLVDHTIDPTGVNGPRRVGLRAFRSFVGGTPYTQGGNATIDQQRFELMTGIENVDQETGFITQAVGDQKGDYTEWASIGPWLHLADGGHLQATVAFGVSRGRLALGTSYAGEFARIARDSTINGMKYRFSPEIIRPGDAGAFAARFPALDNALAAQIAFEGAYESRGMPDKYITDDHGRETPLIAPQGQIFYAQGCEQRDPAARPVSSNKYEYFDFDCDYCTGAYSVSRGGLFHRYWLAEAPPPSPANNLSVAYNYSDNPDRSYVPAGDAKVTLAWDNLSETTPDPKSGQFDFRGYRIWKVSDWQRPVGSGGPNEDDWTLLAEYRLFDFAHTNGHICPPESAAVCTPGEMVGPWVYIPNSGAMERILLYRGDLWDRQTGSVIHADTTVLCKGWPNCEFDLGLPLGQTTGAQIHHDRYPIGRYRYVDRSVKNGFVYFYAVTAFDSTGSDDKKTELGSRRAAVEAEGIVPQTSSDPTSKADRVWVVPNPYRGVRSINARPSSWDLTPNASDPTGTHIDFFGLPRDAWKIKIFTVSGDEVVTLNSTDGVNESVRGPIQDSSGQTHPGYNRQQDNPNDGQARWNLISRNGQDVVSGIYLFTVEVGGSVKHRGKFVIIR